jgi:hypothetical protein
MQVQTCPIGCSGTTCLTQCANCNTSNHCENGNVVRGSCNTSNGQCTKTTVTACTGGRVCSGNQCVCEGGRVFVNGQCVFQCTGCNTSNHCAGGSVVRETCNTSTGRCDTVNVTTCSGGKTCSGGSCVCQSGRDCSGTCRECCEPNHCPANETCSGGNCQPVSCSGVCKTIVNHACGNRPAGTACNGDGQCNGSGTCVAPECTTFADCGDGVSDFCVQCVSGRCVGRNAGMFCQSGYGRCEGEICAPCGFHEDATGVPDSAARACGGCGNCGGCVSSGGRCTCPQLTHYSGGMFGNCVPD